MGGQGMWIGVGGPGGESGHGWEDDEVGCVTLEDGTGSDIWGVSGDVGLGFISSVGSGRVKISSLNLSI